MRYTTEREARQRAVEVARLLRRAFGVYWRVDVWQNINWCWSVTYGYLKVYEARSNCFHTLLGVYFKDDYYSNDPVDAVLHQLKVANAKFAETIDKLGTIILESIPVEEKS